MLWTGYTGNTEHGTKVVFTTRNGRTDSLFLPFYGLNFHINPSSCPAFWLADAAKRVGEFGARLRLVDSISVVASDWLNPYYVGDWSSTAFLLFFLSFRQSVLMLCANQTRQRRVNTKEKYLKKESVVTLCIREPTLEKHLPERPLPLPGRGRESEKNTCYLQHFYTNTCPDRGTALTVVSKKQGYFFNNPNLRLWN